MRGGGGGQKSGNATLSTSASTCTSATAPHHTHVHSTAHSTKATTASHNAGTAQSAPPAALPYARTWGSSQPPSQPLCWICLMNVSRPSIQSDVHASKSTAVQWESKGCLRVCRCVECMRAATPCNRRAPMTTALKPPLTMIARDGETVGAAVVAQRCHARHTAGAR